MQVFDPVKWKRIRHIAYVATALGVLALGAYPQPQVMAGAPVAQPSAMAMATATPVPLGRENPFKPLLGATLPAQGASARLVAPAVLDGSGPVPGIPVIPRAPKQARQTPAPAAVELLGVAYDHDGADGDAMTAVVRVHGKVRFVRRGDTLEGGTVTSISASKLELAGPHHAQVIRKPISTGARTK